MLTAQQVVDNPKVQVVAGAALTATPVWASAIQSYAALVAAVCGAIIGLHGVYRIVLRYVRGKK